jgi:hypothetical protein
MIQKLFSEEYGDMRCMFRYHQLRAEFWDARAKRLANTVDLDEMLVCGSKRKKHIAKAIDYGKRYLELVRKENFRVYSQVCVELPNVEDEFESCQ